MRLALLPAVLLLGACAEDAEISYDRFNAEGETLSVSVGDEGPGELLSIDLHSSTGAVLIGVASVDLDVGPFGTIHQLEVQILEDFVH
jgi:hypothetical protein